MAEKEFIVSHARTRAPITVKGKTLKEALENEGLDPNVWKEIAPVIEPEEPPELDVPDTT